jgi:hypothetical protein
VAPARMRRRRSSWLPLAGVGGARGSSAPARGGAHGGLTLQAWLIGFRIQETQELDEPLATLLDAARVSDPSFPSSWRSELTGNEMDAGDRTSLESKNSCSSPTPEKRAMDTVVFGSSSTRKAALWLHQGKEFRRRRQQAKGTSGSRGSWISGGRVARASPDGAPTAAGVLPLQSLLLLPLSAWGMDDDGDGKAGNEPSRARLGLVQLGG